jgi:trigger factor
MKTLKVETQDLEDRQMRMTVEVPDDRLQAAMRSAARRLSGQKRIPGFRPGKAPYEIILSRLGEGVVFEEAIDTLGQEVYRQALESASVEAFAPGTLEKIVSRTPLVLSYTVPLPPKIDLGEYRETRLPFETAGVEDAAVDAFMEELRQGQALVEPVDRPAQLTDVVVADVVGELPGPEGSQAEPLVKQENASVLVADETDWPVPGVIQYLIGLKAGDEKDFEYTFPEDYPAQSLRARVARFHLTCREVKSRAVPEWTDELARNAGEFTDLMDLRLKVRQGLLTQADRRAEAEYAEKVLKSVVEGSTVTYPPQLLTEEVDDMVKDLEYRLRSQKLALADYLKIQKKTEKELRDELEPRARERLTRALVLSEVVEAEKLETSDEEVNARIETMVAEAEQAGESLRKVLEHPNSRRKLAVDLLTDKAIARLVAIAKGQAEPAPEPAAEAATEAAVEAVSAPIPDTTQAKE